MTVRMGYDFAMTVKYDESEATPLDRGRDNKNDIRAERRKATARALLSTVASYIAVQTVQLFSHKGG